MTYDTFSSPRPTTPRSISCLAEHCLLGVGPHFSVGAKKVSSWIMDNKTKLKKHTLYVIDIVWVEITSLWRKGRQLVGISMSLPNELAGRYSRQTTMYTSNPCAKKATLNLRLLAIKPINCNWQEQLAMKQRAVGLKSSLPSLGNDKF